MNNYNQNKSFFCWTEDNRLQATHDNKTPAYYNYDASGERNLKLTGKFVNMVINGQTMTVPVFANQTLYASPLITLTDKGFTKHYFTEGQRICSSISFGALANTGSTTTPISGTLIALQANAKKNVESTYIMSWNLFPTIITQDFSNKVASGIWDTNGLQLPPSVNNSPTSADAQFYYLSDHLGSSSYITNNIGNVTQTLAYLPFGEDWVNINNSTPYPPMTPYKFNGKEKDEETGFNYFGARYYYDYLSIWLSVDPMSDKYPHLSPYAYCANNPVKYIDPNGDSIKFAPGSSSEFKANYAAATQYLRSNGAGELIDYAENCSNVYVIRETNFETGNSDEATLFDANTRMINWDPTMGVMTNDDKFLSPSTALNHEFDHLVGYDSDKSPNKNDFRSTAKIGSDEQYGSLEERRVITGSEQTTSEKLGEVRKGRPTRRDHGGTPYRTASPITNSKPNTDNVLEVKANPIIQEP